MHGPEDLRERVDRLPRRVGEVGPLDDPGWILRHLHRIQDPPPVGESDGHAAQRGQVVPERPRQVLVRQLPGIEEGRAHRLCRR